MNIPITIPGSSPNSSAPSGSLSSLERVNARLCPKDTDGDGNCGGYYCPWCSDRREIRRDRYLFVVALTQALAADVWGDTTITAHAEEVLRGLYGFDRYVSDTEVRKREGYTAMLSLVACAFGRDKGVDAEDQYPGLQGIRDFLNDQHWLLGRKHLTLIEVMRDLACDLDPDGVEKYPGGHANIRSTYKPLKRKVVQP